MSDDKVSDRKFSLKPLGVKDVSVNNSNEVSVLPVRSVPVEAGTKVDPFSVFKGGKVTNDQNVHDLNIADDNLGMKTEIHDPLVMSVFEMLGDRALEKGYVRTSAVYKNIVRAVKTNMVSFNRAGRREMTDILTAERIAEQAEPRLDGASEKLLGAKGGRR
jgi:hypothetical protein